MYKNEAACRKDRLINLWGCAGENERPPCYDFDNLAPMVEIYLIQGLLRRADCHNNRMLQRNILIQRDTV